MGTTGLSVTAKVKVMSEPMYSIRHVVKEMVLDEFDDVCTRRASCVELGGRSASYLARSLQVDSLAQSSGRAGESDSSL